MTAYTVQSPVKSGGKIYQIGAKITLDDETAAPLLALGRITSVAAKNSSGDASSNENSGDAARQAAESGASPGKAKSGKTSVPRDAK